MSQYESRANRYMRTLIAQIMKIKTCFFFLLLCITRISFITLGLVV